MKTIDRSPVNASDRTPVFRKIYARMRSAILNGDMQPGTRVPSWSDLASELKVSRGTIKAAYDCLTGEGFLVSRGAAGTIVNPELASISHSKRIAKLEQRTSRSPPAHADAFGLTIASGESLPFQMGVPAFDVFPRTLWGRLIARRARALNSHAMGHLPAAGDLQLRAAIASYLGVARGLACSAEQIFITTGYKGSLSLIAQVLLKAGDAVLLEDPGYPLARVAMELIGARVVAAPVDEEGMNVAALSARASKAKLAIVTPSHHAPLGMPLSLPRRLALLEWANRQSAWIVEDDYYGEFRLQSRPLPALANLDQQRVLYAGTFSKVLLPSLRLGYVVAPSSLQAAFMRVTNYLAPSPAPLLQAATADFMQQGHFARHIRRMTTVYSERRVAMIKALHTHFGEELKFRASALHIVLSLPKHSDDIRIAARAMQHGLAPGPLTPWFINAQREQGLLLSFANVPAKEANRRIKQLAEVIAASSKAIRRR
jgi:GntR family transcriptional regulator/MocR family aminotransferase